MKLKLLEKLPNPIDYSSGIERMSVLRTILLSVAVKIPAQNKKNKDTIFSSEAKFCLLRYGTITRGHYSSIASRICPPRPDRG